jgi:hypothetical protein
MFSLLVEYSAQDVRAAEAAVGPLAITHISDQPQGPL